MEHRNVKNILEIAEISQWGALILAKLFLVEFAVPLALLKAIIRTNV